MKKNVLFLMVFAFLAIVGAKAQTVVYDWNFSDANVWNPAFGGYTAGVTTTVAGLSFTPGSSATNFGATNSNSKTVDGVDYTIRMQLNGGGYSGSADGQTTPSVNMPTQRYLSFAVDGNVTIDIVGISGNGSNTRYIFLTDGTNLLGTYTFDGATATKETVSYTGGATTLYLFGNQSCNIYEIIVTSGDNTGISSVNADKPIKSMEYFDLFGKKVMDANQKNAVLIKKTTYTDGTVSSDKIITKSY